MSLGVHSKYYLDWHVQALQLVIPRQVQPTDMSTIGISWGDDCSTGAGDNAQVLSNIPPNDPVSMNVI